MVLIWMVTSLFEACAYVGVNIFSTGILKFWIAWSPWWLWSNLVIKQEVTSGFIIITNSIVTRIAWKDLREETTSPLSILFEMN